MHVLAFADGLIWILGGLKGVNGFVWVSCWVEGDLVRVLEFCRNHIDCAFVRVGGGCQCRLGELAGLDLASVLVSG